MGIKSILWILVIIMGVYGVMGPTQDKSNMFIFHSEAPLSYPNNHKYSSLKCGFHCDLCFCHFLLFLQSYILMYIDKCNKSYTK